MDPIIDSHQIFKEIADKFGANTISGTVKVAEFFEELLSRTKGLVTLDFLDLTNWDKIEKFHVDNASGILTLTWHDYRDTHESAEDREIRQMVFPASLYACALQVNSIVPIVGKTSAIFFVNAYAKTEKEIRKFYIQNTDEFKLFNNSFFEKRVIRKADGHWEIIDFHCTPIFSIAIIPKMSGLSSHDSKNFLYWHNLTISLDRINRVLAVLDTIDSENTDDIAEKANTVRRIMEFVLKVECCSLELDISNNYSQLLLGDLISLVKHHKEATIQTLLGRFAEMANELSHDSGKPIELSKAKAVAAIALAYTNQVELEHRRNVG